MLNLNDLAERLKDMPPAELLKLGVAVGIGVIISVILIFVAAWVQK